MEGHEEGVRALIRRDPSPGVCRAAGRRDGHEIAVGDLVDLRQRGVERNMGFGGGGEEFRHAPGLGA